MRLPREPVWQAHSRGRYVKQRLSPRLSREPKAMICMAGENAETNSQRQQELRLDRVQLSDWLVSVGCGIVRTPLVAISASHGDMAPAASLLWLTQASCVCPHSSNCHTKSSPRSYYPFFTHCMATGRVHSASSVAFFSVCWARGEESRK